MPVWRPDGCIVLLHALGKTCCSGDPGIVVDPSDHLARHFSPPQAQHNSVQSPGPRIASALGILRYCYFENCFAALATVIALYCHRYPSRQYHQFTTKAPSNFRQFMLDLGFTIDIQLEDSSADGRHFGRENVLAGNEEEGMKWRSMALFVSAFNSIIGHQPTLPLIILSQLVYNLGLELGTPDRRDPDDLCNIPRTVTGKYMASYSSRLRDKVGFLNLDLYFR
ncbi:hypothetical protein C8J56DRAFT_897008 [Mycena floridula]|nr:hypothetical protein C8J56DRAFT_897008 [Mycena floridula]